MKFTEVDSIDIGEHVYCDRCGKDYSGSDEGGGVAVGSSAYGPCCAKILIMEKNDAGDSWKALEFCPPDKSFKQWCLDHRGGDNTLKIGELEL